MPAPSTPIEPEQDLALLLAGTAAFRARHHERALALAALADVARLEAFLLLSLIHI